MIDYKIGIDIGRVIIGSDTDQKDLFFGKNFLNAPEVENSFESIKKIIMYYTGQNVYLVSKCGQETREKTIQWLVHKNFFERTNFKKENIFFCDKREEKKIIARDLKLNIFVDDRFTVLKHLLDLPKMNLFLFNPKENELEAFKSNFSEIKLVYTWKEIISDLFP